MTRLRPERVLFFSSHVSHESGASYAMRFIVKRISSVGIKPLVVIPESSDSRAMFPQAQYDVVYMNIRRPRKSRNPLTHLAFFLAMVPSVLALRRLMRERNIELVHFNEITDSVAGVAARLAGVPCVCHVRADRPSNPYRWLLMQALQFTVQAIIVPSNSAAAWVKAERPVPADRVRLVYDYAFDIAEYEQPATGTNLREELKIPRDGVLIVAVSKLVVPKGHQCFIRAAARVRQQNDKVFFVIVGGPVEGHDAEANAITALATELVPQPGLHLLGARSDVPAIYKACDIAVHCPIFADTFPTVVLLPMLAAKAVIGSNIGGIPEQIDDGKTGVLVAANDADALAAAMLQLAADPARRSALGSAAYAKITRESAAERQGAVFAELYAEVSAQESYRHTSVATAVSSSSARD